MVCSREAVLAVVLNLVSLSSANHAFIYEIPNGERIPNPCDPTTTWLAVGHEDKLGGGPRNPFGMDFGQAGSKWTKELCQKDSDDDGRTNGEELGDPKCVWSKGATPAVTGSSQLSHPGICEPITSATCSGKNSFLKDCKALGLTTPSVGSWCPDTKKPDVKSLTLRYRNANLSSDETIYMCQAFDLPNDQEYQMIAWEPIVDNRKILHHMALYACDQDLDEFQEFITDEWKNAPVNCPMFPYCKSMIVAWAYGIDGQCYQKDIGAPFGKRHYKRILLQMHYNNEEKKAGYVDNSGLKLYYTNVPRPNQKGLLAFGEMFLKVPPKTEYYQTPPAVLPSTCTSQIFRADEKYFLTSMLMHIHRQGVFAQVIIEKKTGKQIFVLNSTFTYDRPKVATWTDSNEIVLEPGDKVRVSCGYNTLNKDRWSFFGSQTRDEMCFAFFDVHPRPQGANFLMLANMGPSFDACAQMNFSRGQPMKHCELRSFHKKLMNVNANETLNVCSCHDYPVGKCSSACYSVMLKENLLNDSCIDNEEAFQFALRAFFDDSEILHIAQSQMQLCQKLTSPPPSGQLCAGIKNYASGRHKHLRSGGQTSRQSTGIISIIFFALLHYLLF